MTDTQPMAPCPFCGGAARPVKHSAGVPRTMGYDQWHGVSCTACNACVGTSDRRFRAASEAAAAWNRRAPQPVAREPLTDEDLRKWWASGNGLEDCDMCKLADFTTVVRAVEEMHRIKGGQHP